MRKEVPLDDDDLMSAVADLMDEVRVDHDTEVYVNGVEEDLDEDGELTDEQRVRMREILAELGVLKQKGILIDDDFEDDLEDEVEELEIEDE